MRWLVQPQGGFCPRENTGGMSKIGFFIITDFACQGEVLFLVGSIY